MTEEELKALAEDRDFKHHLFLVALKQDTVGLRDFVLASVIDPDGKAFKDMREMFSLIPKSTVAFLNNLIWR